jgi:hypothetical protein
MDAVSITILLVGGGGGGGGDIKAADSDVVAGRQFATGTNAIVEAIARQYRIKYFNMMVPKRYSIVIRDFTNNKTKLALTATTITDTVKSRARAAGHCVMMLPEGQKIRRTSAN